MQQPQFLAEIVDLAAQSFSIGPVNLLNRQLRQQVLGLVESGRELGEPTGAAGGSWYEVMVHGTPAYGQPLTVPYPHPPI